MATSRRRVEGEEAAHRRIARTLHDDHGQRLAALGFEIQALRRHLPEDEAGLEALDEIVRQVGGVGEDLHRLSHQLHPAILERQGLATALRDTCLDFEVRHGLRVELDLEDSGLPLPEEVALGLYRIVQEALLNAVRHARASTVRLSLRIGAGTVRLSLHDDGVGFDMERVRRDGDGGLGLSSMEERARLLGGRYRLHSRVGRGTSLHVWVPRRRLGRWLLRNRHWLLVITVVVLALGGGLAATLVQADRAAAQARQTEEVVRFLENLFASADPRQAQGERLDARELLDRGVERLDRELGDQPVLRARLLDTLGGIHTELGLYDQARPLLEEALALRLQLRGTTHPDTVATLVRLGALAHYSGHGESVALFERALGALEERGDGRSPAAADILNKLGAALGAQHRFDEAWTVLQRSRALHERLFGPDDLRVAKVVHNLSGVAYYREDLQEAERLLERALEIREARLAEDDLELAGSREALAMFRMRGGHSREAARLFERLASSYERIYGPDHPRLALTLLNLGLVDEELGLDDAASESFERAVAINEKALAADHPQHIRSLDVLAAHRLRRGEVEAAEALYRGLLTLHAQGAPYHRWDAVLAGWRELRQDLENEASESQE